MAKMINSVTGPISTDDFGAVLAHEHIVFGYPGYQSDESFDVWDEEEFFRVITPQIEEIKAQGIKTIVDATPNDYSRNPSLLKRIAERLDINIIVSTGFYYEATGGTAYWNFRKGLGFPVEEEIYQVMERELYEGIGKTGIKAGIIKLASGIGEITEYELMAFRSAARLAKNDPDIRIMTHCSYGTMLRAQADFFLEQGVNPSQVMLGHFCDTASLVDQLYCMSKGFYAGFDRLGQVGFDGMMDTDEERFAAICALVSAGYGDHIMLSNDRIGWFFGRELPIPEALEKNCLANWKWSYIMGKVLPKLQEMGLTEKQATRLVYENPAAFYGGE